jgi:VWFA-related protein
LINFIELFAGTNTLMKKLIALLGVAGIVCARAQVPGPPHTVGKRLVLVDVLVRTKTGPVTGLTRDDFSLQDKGKQQKIEVFAATPVRDAAANPTPLSPRIGRNKMTRRGEPVQAATVIVNDRLNTPPEDQAFVRKQVLATLATLKETDIFAFYSLGRSLTAVHDFTEDPAVFLRAVARLNATPPQPPPADPAEQAMQSTLADALQAQQSIDALFRVATTARALASITRHLSGLPGRKSIAWITRSFPTTFGGDFNRRGELEKELSAPIVTLQEENIALYPINPGGVGKGYGDHSTNDTSDQAAEGHLLPGANASIVDAGAISDNSTMENFAHATGGLAFYNLNDVTSKVRDVMADSDLTYTLGYYPDDKMLDGKSHDFGVKVKAAGATLRFRKQYIASKEDPRLHTPPIPELATDPLEATAVGLVAVAQPDPGHPGTQRVDVSVNLNDLTLNHEGDHWTAAFEMGLSINGSMGSSGGMRVFNLKLTDDQLHQAQKSGGVIVNDTIDTGNQQVYLRAIVRDKTSGAAGSVRVPLAAN